MILVDTSVWADHFRDAEPALGRLLEQGMVLTYAFVIGELALGNLRPRAVVIDALRELLQAPTVRGKSDSGVTPSQGTAEIVAIVAGRGRVGAGKWGIW